jgi:hypothetical protein
MVYYRYVATFANISLGTLFSQIIPLELMGRASTIMSMAMTILIPIGQIGTSE